VLPIVAVLSNMVHFFLALPILAIFLVFYAVPLNLVELVWFPFVILVQLILSLGLGLLLAALTVHFRDLKDLLANLLTLWFFCTPIIYPMSMLSPTGKLMMNLNPVAHLSISYQEILFYEGSFGHWRWLLAIFVGSLVMFFVGYIVFDRLRDSFEESI
jgi:ABC-type polysaccharide/polyol phosphate export permease